jgi:hypothetical protein
MTSRMALVLALLLAPLAGGCATDAAADGTTHANNPHNETPNTQGIGPNGAVGAAPRDMPGAGRGSATPRGK